MALPRSSDPGRIRANLDVAGFRLSAAERARVDALSQVSPPPQPPPSQPPPSQPRPSARPSTGPVGAAGD